MKHSDLIVYEKGKAAGYRLPDFNFYGKRVLLASSFFATLLPASAQKTNIVYIFTDQQTATAMSCAGNKDIHTPNMDRLAQKGVRFVNAYCASPLSSPSRSAMFTGLTPGETDMLVNGASIPGKYAASTLGSLVAAHGYDCGYAGKWHLPKNNIPDKIFGFTHLYDHKDMGLAEACVDFIRRKRSQPFFLVASFDNPHNICQYARSQSLPYKEITEPESIRQCPALPQNFAIQPYDADVIRFEQRQDFSLYPVADFSPDQWRRYRNAYFRLVEYVDMEIGKILSALEESGLMDRTLIIFSSDHGDGAGAHRWSQKSALYEEVVNIPFIIKFPGNRDAGTTNDLLINNGIDLLPSICGYLGVKIPDYCNGMNIFDALQQGKTNPREYIVSEIQFDRSSTKGWMVRTEKYKYVLYDKGAYREQLYDMENDRGEMVNLAVDARYDGTVERHRALLAQWVKDHHIKMPGNVLPK